MFDSRTTILGHLQQGGIPSPLDRIRATKLAVNCIDWLQKASLACKVDDCVSTKASTDCCVIGIKGADLVMTPIEELMADSDLTKRRLVGIFFNVLLIGGIQNIWCNYPSGF